MIRRLLGLWLVPVALVAWEVAARLAEAIYFPPPSVILPHMLDLWFAGPATQLFLTDEAIADIIPSLARLAAGWALAAFVGVGAGIFLGRLPGIAAFVDPIVHFFRSVPPAALIPVFLLFVAIGSPLQIISIIFGVIWPVLINSIDGARDIDRQYHETSQIFQLPRLTRLFRVILPAAGPKIFAGLRLSVSLALIMMIISELYGSSEGIGHRLDEAQADFDIDTMWAAIVLLGLLGVILNAAFVGVERRVLAWHRGSRR